MKLSVSLPAEDVEFLDQYARTKGYESRSAVVHRAVRLLRSADLGADYSADGIEIGFNASLLIDVITNVDTEEVAVEMSEPNRAGLILPNVQDDGENILMLIMPIMLNSYVGT